MCFLNSDRQTRGVNNSSTFRPRLSFGGRRGGGGIFICFEISSYESEAVGVSESS